jgi:hypothetical protein
VDHGGLSEVALFGLNSASKALKPASPNVPQAATPAGDAEAEGRASGEAERRARARAALDSRQRSILAGGAAAPQGQRRTLLGVSGTGL